MSWPWNGDRAAFTLNQCTLVLLTDSDYRFGHHSLRCVIPVLLRRKFVHVVQGKRCKLYLCHRMACAHTISVHWIVMFVWLENLICSGQWNILFWFHFAKVKSFWSLFSPKERKMVFSKDGFRSRRKRKKGNLCSAAKCPTRPTTLTRYTLVSIFLSTRLKISKVWNKFSH